jgi:hypothetical protein
MAPWQSENTSVALRELSTVRAAVKALQDDHKALQRELEDIKSLLLAGRSLSSVSSAPSADAEPNKSPAKEPPLAKLSARVESESYDAAWAPLAEEKIQNRLRALAATDVVDEVTCASTLCRVVLTGSNTERLRHVAVALSQKPPWNEELHMATDGDQRVRFFFMRGQPEK